MSARDKATPRPWRYVDNKSGEVIVCQNSPRRGYYNGVVAEFEYWSCERAGRSMVKANAALIVRAVNAHDEIVEALRDIIQMIDNCSDVPRNPDSLPMMVLSRARAALARAQGESS